MLVTLQLETRLGGHPSTTGVLEGEERPRSKRVVSAIGTLVGFLVLAAIVVFIPPHIPWVLTAIIAGIILSYRQWRGEYRVVRMSTTCPRCGNELTVKEGEGVRLPMKMTCFKCHHEPLVTIAG